MLPGTTAGSRHFIKTRQSSAYNQLPSPYKPQSDTQAFNILVGEARQIDRMIKIKTRSYLVLLYWSGPKICINPIMF